MVDMINLTLPDGNFLAVVPDKVVALRGPVADGSKHFSKHVKCQVLTLDGKFIAVVEECPTVQRALQDECDDKD